MLDDARESLLSDAASLPAGPCKGCEREVLAYRLPDEGDTERWACVHCDQPVRRVYLVVGVRARDPRLRRRGSAARRAAARAAPPAAAASSGAQTRPS